MIKLFALAMRKDIPASRVYETLLACPTFSLDVKNMF